MHIHVPQNLTYHGVKVDDYHDVRLEVGAGPPDPEQVEAIAAALADALQDGRRSSSSLASARSAATRRRRSSGSSSGSRSRSLTTLDGKGIVAERHPLAVGVFSESGHSSAWKAFREADVVLAIGNSLNQHATFGFATTCSTARP